LVHFEKEECMTKLEGSGVQTVLRLASGAMKLLPESEARSFVDGLTDVELAEAMVAASAAARAAGGQPNLFYESAAARLLGVDVESFTSKPPPGGSFWVGVTPKACGVQFGEHRCVRPAGHETPHTADPIEGEPTTTQEQ
jgi:hypothetical protein